MPTRTDLKRVADLPMMEKRDDGVDDLTFLEGFWRQGDLARDSLGFVYSFPYANFEHLLDDRFTRQIETEGVRMRGINKGAIFDFFNNSLLTSNGQTHKARRTPLARSFAFPMMKALRPEVRRTADDLVASLSGRDEVDLINEVAGPMPARIIARVLGVPEADVPFFTALVYSAIRSFAARSADVIREAEADMAQLTAYVAGLLEKRRAVPEDDFLSGYLAAVADTELNEAEIRITIVTLILAGSDTTRASIAMTFARLLQHPEQWARLVDDPERWKGPTVEEGLRFDPVVGTLARIAVAEFDLSGTWIVPGTVLLPSMLTTMRDPAVFADPDRFDITRTDHPRYSPAFGGGVHRCLGEALARIEMEEAIAAFARHWPEARLTGAPPAMRGLSGTRGISSMTVAPAGAGD